MPAGHATNKGQMLISCILATSLRAPPHTPTHLGACRWVPWIPCPGASFHTQLDCAAAPSVPQPIGMVLRCPACYEDLAGPTLYPLCRQYHERAVSAPPAAPSAKEQRAQPEYVSERARARRIFERALASVRALASLRACARVCWCVHA